MTVTFTEKELSDGYLQISWDADTPREWKRVLHCIKTMIPKKERAFVSQCKAWTIAPTARHIYDGIKHTNTSQDGEEILGELIDPLIEEEATLNAINYELSQLPKTMKKKAVFAIKAAMGEIDVPVQFSFSKGLFGAWNEEKGVWFYEDGRYSGYSPTQWDDKTISKAYKRISVAQEHLAKTLDELDKIPEEREKQLFRIAALQRYNYRCYVCNSKPDDLGRLQMHRILPGRLGGQYTENNVVILCTSCHRYLEGSDWNVVKNARQENELYDQL